MDPLKKLLIIEDVKQLKYRYTRAIDTGDLELMKKVFAKEASCAFYGGSYTHVYETREEVLNFLAASFTANCISKHNVHNPEIDIISETSVKAKWGLSDFFEDFEHKVITQGAAFYEDEYVLEDGEWKIKHTGYKRLFEQIIPSNPNAQLTAHYLGEKK